MKKLLLLLITFILSNNSFATHIIGAEIHYLYMGNNNYHIIVKVYRDCTASTGYDNPLHLGIYDSLNNLIQQIDIPIPPITTIPNNANNPCLIIPPDVCAEEGIYETDVTLPPIAGGYNICWQRCCRNNNVLNLLNPQDQGASHFAHIPGILNADNSDPLFNSFPPTVICSNIPLEFDHSATDDDGDSLVYALCIPFNDFGGGNFNPNPPLPPPYPSVDYQAPYTYLDPIGNNSLVIDPATGLLTGVPIDLGKFIVAICVKEYRDGVLLSEHRRDFQFNVANCTQTAQAITTPQITNCTDLTISFTNNSVSTIAPFYYWDFGVSGIITDTSTLFTPTYTFPDTGTYIVKLIVNPGTVCSDSTEATVTMYPTLTPFITAPDGCTGNQIQFNDSSISTFGNVTNWLWSFGDNGTSTQQNPQHIYTAPGNYVVQLIASTSLGCLDTVSETISILTGPITSTYGDTVICKLDDVVIGVDAIGTFQWTPNYNISSLTSASPQVSPDINTTYYVTATSLDGCTESDSVIIVVFDTVIALVSNDTVICPGQSVSLYGSGGLNYNWSPSNTLSNSNSQLTVATPTGTTDYIFTTSVGSCISSDTIKVTVNPFPTLSIDDQVSICKGDSIQLFPFGCNVFSWSPSQGLSATNIANPWASPTVNTTYAVTASDSTTCPIILKDSISVNIYVDPYLVGYNNTIILGTTASLNANNGSSFSWQPSSSLNDPSLSNPLASPTVTTTYTVIITFANGCKVIDSVLIIVDPNPIVDLPSAFSPNGDGKNDLFHPLVKGLVDLQVFKVYNRWGQVVFETTDINAGWDGKKNGVEQEVGSYAYLLIGKGEVGNKEINLKGNLTLVR